MALNIGGIGQSFAAGNVGKSYFDAYYKAKEMRRQEEAMKQKQMAEQQRMELENRGLGLQSRRLDLQERQLGIDETQIGNEQRNRERLAALYGIDDSADSTVPETRRTTGIGRVDSGPLTESLTPMQRDESGLLMVKPDSPREDLIFRAHQTAQKHGLDPRKFVAMIQAESGFINDAQSPENKNNWGRAQGLGQIIPSTQDLLGLKDPFDPASNLDAAARYIVEKGGKDDFYRAVYRYHGGGEDITGTTSSQHVDKVKRAAEQMGEEYDQIISQYGLSPDFVSQSAGEQPTGDFFTDLGTELGEIASGVRQMNSAQAKQYIDDLNAMALAEGDVESANELAEMSEQIVGEDPQGNLIALPDREEIEKGAPAQPRVVSQRDVSAAIMGKADRLATLRADRQKAQQRVQEIEQRGNRAIAAEVLTGDLTGVPAVERRAAQDVMKAEDDVRQIDKEIFKLEQDIAKAETDPEKEALTAEMDELKLRKLRADTEKAELAAAASDRMNGGETPSSTMVTAAREAKGNLNSFVSFYRNADPEFFGTITGLETEASVRDALTERFGADSPRVQYWKEYERFRNQLRNQLFGSALTANEDTIFRRSDINKATNPEMAREFLRRQMAMAIRASATLANEVLVDTNGNVGAAEQLLGAYGPIGLMQYRASEAIKEGRPEEAAQYEKQAASSLYQILKSQGITDKKAIRSTFEDVFGSQEFLVNKYLKDNNGEASVGTGAGQSSERRRGGLNIQ